MPNFGDGYPGKKYEDAACECAYNALVVKAHPDVLAAFPYWNIRDWWIKGKIPNVYWQRTFAFDLFIESDFPAFRAAFLLWCKNRKEQR